MSTLDTPNSSDQHRVGRIIGFTVTAAVLTAVGAILMMTVDGSLGWTIPAAIAAIAVAIKWPWVFFGLVIASYSIIPMGGYVWRLHVPDTTQLLVPALTMSVLASAVSRKRWGTFSLRVADVFVLALIAVGFIGMLMEPRFTNWKMFGKEFLFGVAYYFIIRWVDIDRERFERILKWVAGAAAFMLADILLVQLTGIGRIWLGQGPMGNEADQGTYSALFPPMFLYLAALHDRKGDRRRTLLWLAIAAVGLLAIANIPKRSAVAAALLAVGFCALHPRMRKHVLIGGLCLLPIAALWLGSSHGQALHSKFTDPADPGLRRRYYRQRALNYMRSEEWQPLWGTGFWKLKDLSAGSLSETELVWDANKEYWRPANELGGYDRNIHCSPLMLLGEFGYAGTAAFIAVLLSVAVSVARAYRSAGHQRARFDSALIVALTGSALGLLLNASYHNTIHQVPVVVLFWTVTGLLVGHPNILILNNRANEDEEGSDVNKR
ncbi:MAG: hypothetical protein GF393_03610 [Armatimonadia bacterium]|nr:hypothetical protein [Armatimonadia bacterium]